MKYYCYLLFFITFDLLIFCNSADKSSFQFSNIVNNNYKLNSIKFNKKTKAFLQYDSLNTIGKLPPFEIMFQIDSETNKSSRAQMFYNCNHSSAPFKVNADTVLIDFNNSYGTKKLCGKPQLAFESMFDTTRIFKKRDTLFLITMTQDTAVLIIPESDD